MNFFRAKKFATAMIFVIMSFVVIRLALDICLMQNLSQFVDYPSPDLVRTQMFITIIRGISYPITIAFTAWAVNKYCSMKTYIDPLTGLFSRSKLDIDLANILKKDEQAAICYLDMTGFKNINDTLGHSNGDILLKKMAKRLESLPSSMHSYRVNSGGDEFVITIQGYSDLVSEINAITSLSLEEFNIAGKKVKLGFGVGIALYPIHSNNIEDLIDMADEAMYRSKQREVPYFMCDQDIIEIVNERKRTLDN